MRVPSSAAPLSRERPPLRIHTESLNPDPTPLREIERSRVRRGRGRRHPPAISFSQVRKKKQKKKPSLLPASKVGIWRHLVVTTSPKIHLFSSASSFPRLHCCPGELQSNSTLLTKHVPTVPRPQGSTQEQRSQTTSQQFLPNSLEASGPAIPVEI